MKLFFAQVSGLGLGTFIGAMAILLMAQSPIGAWLAFIAGPVISICIYKVISERLADK